MTARLATAAAVDVLETPSLGDRSYLVSDGDVALAIDPQRDIKRVLELAEERRVRITHVLETHIHNDYVTGGLALARWAHAEYLVPDGETVAYPHGRAGEGTRLHSGGLTVDTLHTPGHTPTHVAFAVALDDVPVGLFTGGSMLYGAVGRPDLIGPDWTPRLARLQHASVRRLAEEYGDDLAVYPTHGFGSYCSSVGADSFRAGTVGEERLRNPALQEDDPEAFAATLLAGLGPYPRYYAHMGPANRSGPTALAVSPPPDLRPCELAAHLDSGSWVVDLRPRTAFAECHLRGSVSVELRDDLPTYLGWVYAWGSPLVLLAERDEDVAAAQLLLGRIGIEEFAGVVVGAPSALGLRDRLASFRRVRWPEVNEQRPADAVVVDVRDRWEFDSGHHSAAIHLPFHDVVARAGELPPNRPLWLYCATGNRATVAASMLANLGRDVTLIDDFCLPGDVPG